MHEQERLELVSRDQRRSDPDSGGYQPQTERRKERRIPVNLRASMRIMDAFFAEKIPVRVLDMSRGGLRILCSVALAPETRVNVQTGKYRIYGIIRHCTVIDEFSYSCGVQIQKREPLQRWKQNR